MSSTELITALDIVRQALKEAEDSLEAQFQALRTPRAEPLMELTARCAEKIDAVSLAERFALETLLQVTGSTARLDDLPSDIRPKVVAVLSDLRARAAIIARKQKRNARAADLLAQTVKGMSRSLGAEPERRGFGVAARYGSAR